MKMTLEEMFRDLYDKYGNDFNWYMIPFAQADGAFVAELNKEIGQDHFLYGKKIWAVAKCESNDDVLYAVSYTHLIIWTRRVVLCGILKKLWNCIPVMILSSTPDRTWRN